MRRASLLSVIIILIFLLPSCSKKKTDDRYSMGNIISASFRIIKDKGFSALSGEEINAEIDKSYSLPEDVLQLKSTIRQREADGSNNYRIIYEDLIDKERDEKERTYKDPLKQ